MNEAYLAYLHVNATPIVMLRILPLVRCVLQGMIVTETIVEHLAKSLGMDPHLLRTKNLYKVKVML